MIGAVFLGAAIEKRRGVAAALGAAALRVRLILTVSRELKNAERLQAQLF